MAFLFSRLYGDAFRQGLNYKRSDFPLPLKATTVTTSLLHHLAAFMLQPLLLTALTSTTASREGAAGGGFAGPFNPTV